MNTLAAAKRSFCSAATLALGALALLPMPSQAGNSAQPGPAAPTLQVGMSYVVPPFVGGSKVRTPEAIDTALAQALAGKLALALQAVPAQAGGKEMLLGEDRPRAVLVPASDVQSTRQTSVTIPTGYELAPMAIMRTDTDIKSWKQLKDRTVCLSEGGRYVGTMAARYGAREMIYRAPADALLALRTGECDAAVHDETMLRSLLKLPEWKKFSANLTVKDKEPLVFVAAADDQPVVSALKQLTREWKSRKELAALTKTRANDIAFEVYLDQVVADCH
ncbi:transporter substrate-binding domain-containing protein [Pusillimonas sp. MFBS29]|uniref:transporter substrate-binding domain-containing protein n=1 Tax=Pusillimonas sp. MFBS29 TaxID=2886690 RepID=UPI001D0FD09B|nr:transporter substrate-binding domain-containing protein [Pusillimonas sp. MFBS29]MCC2596795.1 transporter substrate-binding domain-containing protein [Pusillimonas sp. MFBS29]